MTVDATERLRQFRKLRRDFVDTPGGQVHYRSAGTGPPLVLIHQALSSGVQWSAVIPIFAQSNRVLAPDLPGYGDSYHPDRQPTFAEYAGFIAEFLDAVGVERASVVGFHLGAALVVEFAARYPQRVDRVLVSGLPYYAEVGKWLLRDHKYILTEITYGEPETTLYPGPAGGPPEPVERRMSMAEYMGEMIEKELPIEATLQGIDRIAQHVLARFQAMPNGHWMLFSALDQPLKEQLRDLRAPTLFFWASNDVVKDMQLELAALVPNVKTVVIEEATKMPMDQRPEAFCRIAMEFLASPA